MKEHGSAIILIYSLKSSSFTVELVVRKLLMRIKYHLALLGILLLVVGGATLILDSSNTSLNNILPSASTSIDTYPDYVTKGCHPALSPNMTYYEICP
jgi:hypothetical protein